MHNWTSLHVLCCSALLLVELEQFLEKLDERYEAKLKKDNVLMARKVRRVGEESCRKQPSSAPKWTVKQPAGQCCSPKTKSSNLIYVSLVGGGVLAEAQDQPFTIQD